MNNIERLWKISSMERGRGHRCNYAILVDTGEDHGAPLLEVGCNPELAEHIVSIHNKWVRIQGLIRPDQVPHLRKETYGGRSRVSLRAWTRQLLETFAGKL